jgi:hypothetical protein
VLLTKKGAAKVEQGGVVAQGGERPMRKTAIVGLMLEGGLSSAEIAAMDLLQLSSSNPRKLCSDRSAELYGTAEEEAKTPPLRLSHGLRYSLARYIVHERGADADGIAAALFVTAASDPVNRVGARLPVGLVEKIVGGEHNLRVVTAAPGAAIPAAVLLQIRRLAGTWAERNAHSQVSAASVVSTTYERAVQAVHESGSGVAGWPDRPVYLIVLEGAFARRHAADAGTPPAPSGSWAALIVHQSPPLRIGPSVLRPRAPEGFELRKFGQVHPIELKGT